MQRLPDDYVDKVYSQIDILQIIQTFLPNLKKKGKDYWAKSPWNTAERTPSFSVSVEKNLFKDFSSGEGGSAISFLMKYCNLGYRDALLEAGAICGIPEPVFETNGFEPMRDPVAACMGKYASKYHDDLYSSDEALCYLMDEREISENVIDTFGVGFCQGGSLDALDSEDQREMMIEAGLVAMKEDRPWEFFKGRVTFPVHDIIGRPIGMVGRLPRKMNKGEGWKYINTPETKLYHKGKSLYGIYQAKRDIRLRGHVILVEGQLDVLGLWSENITNVVGGSGTALTEAQSVLLANVSDGAVVMYDGEASGQRAMIKAIDQLVKVGFSPEVYVLERGMDPDDLRRKHGPATLQVIDKGKIHYLDHYINFWKMAAPPLKVRTVEKMCETISFIPDEVERSGSVDYVAKKMDVTKGAVWDKVTNFIPRKKKTSVPVSPSIESHPGYQVLQLACLFPDKKQEIWDMMGIEDNVSFGDPLLDSIKVEIFSDDPDMEVLTIGEVGKVYAGMCVNNSCSYSEDIAQSVCDKFRLHQIKKLIQETTQAILGGNGDVEFLTNYKSKLNQQRILIETA